MNEGSDDARLEELRLLSEIERHGELELSPVAGPFRDMVAYLVQERFVNHLNLKPGTISGSGIGGLPGESHLERSLHSESLETLYRVLEGSSTKVRLSHRGRLRLSELKQALRTGREREPLGILWDARHWERDVQIAILEAREDLPLSLAYLDMNGLKLVNDKHGHDDGDQALSAYFQAVGSVLGDRGQAYRLSGGADEVLVSLPRSDKDASIRIIEMACNKLMAERLWPTDTCGLLSISAGIVTTTDPRTSPSKLRSTADILQVRAKDKSRQCTPRPSVIAVEGRSDLIVIEHGPFGFPVKISGSYFEDYAHHLTGITIEVVNIGRDALPPFKISLFHPKLGSHCMFPSEKSGPLLRDQRREHRCPIIVKGGVPEWFPRFTVDGSGQELVTAEDAHFEFRLVLEDSDKVLYSNKRIARGLVRLFRQARQPGSKFGVTGDDLRELSNALPDN